jgi:HEAT repeat protein/uncharacterized protein DUF1573
MVDRLRQSEGKGSGRRCLAALSLVALSISAGCGGDESSAPGLALESGVYELGSLVPGQHAVNTLSLRNPGSKTLVVRTVRTSSSRLNAAVVPTRLRPDERGTLELDFHSNTWDNEGPFEYLVLVYSNDPEEPLVKLAVRGSLESPITWKPKIPLVPSLRRGMTVDLVRVEAGDSRTDPGPLRVESFVPFATAEAIREGPGAYRVVLKIDPAVPLGPLQGWVRIQTRNREQPEVDVPFRGTVVGNLRTNPYQLDFGFVREGRVATAAVTLLTRPGHKVDVVTVEPRLPAKVDVSVRRQGRNHQISVRVPSAPRRWSLAGQLNVYTDDPLQPVVQVPVVGWVWTPKPFARVAAEGNDAGLYSLLKGALYAGEDTVPPEDIARKVLGGGRDARAVALLLRAQRDDNWYVRQRATDVLGVLEARQALAAVRAAVTDDVDSDVREAAANALVKIEGKAALPQLLLALQDDDEFVRFDVAQLLGRLGDKGAIPALLRAAKSDPDPDTRAAARRSLKVLAAAS